MLIHGFPDYWYTWRAQMPELARRIQVVAIDQRGYNLSDKPEGVENYAIDKLVGDVAAVVKHFGRDKATVVGHDWGGMVAWTFAMTHPEMIDRLDHPQPAAPAGPDARAGQQPRPAEGQPYARDFQKPDAAAKLTPRDARLLGQGPGGPQGTSRRSSARRSRGCSTTTRPTTRVSPTRTRPARYLPAGEVPRADDPRPEGHGAAARRA